MFSLGTINILPLAVAGIKLKKGDQEIIIIGDRHTYTQEEGKQLSTSTGLINFNDGNIYDKITEEKQRAELIQDIKNFDNILLISEDSPDVVYVKFLSRLSELAQKNGIPAINAEIRHKLQIYLSKFFRNENLSIDDKEEAVDILLWCIGDDVTTLHITKWPDRIMIKTNVKFDPKTTPMMKVLRAVAREWQSRKQYLGAINLN